jgi:CRP/FNR family transcriptional regulator, cyclic AMP receptor protein
MKATNVSELPGEIISSIFNRIPFISRALDADPCVEDFFLNESKVFEAEPGEVIIRRGEFDNWVYFLMLGQLLVYPEYYDKKKNLVSYISPGEMFGELAYLRDLNRNATLIADDNSKRVSFLGTDLSSFGEADDFRAVTLSTKISFFRTAVRTIRKRLETLKIDFPENELVINSPTHRPFEGPRNTMRELLYLQDQSKTFARHMHKWNRSLEMDSNYQAARGAVPIEQVKSLLHS